MQLLLDRMRGRTKTREKPSTEVPRPPPPTERRPITPSPTRDNSTDQVLRASLGIFGKLPPELRWQVLTLAFGDRILHLDLRYMPVRRRDRSVDNVHDQARTPCSYKHSIVLPGLPIPYNEDCAWQWYGGVCHSQAPGRRRPLAQCIRGTPPQKTNPSSYSWPHEDHCLRGRAGACPEWTTSHGGAQDAHCDARIGVMGWLLACRQAYMEGTAVLYGSNSFRIESRELLDALLDPDNPQRALLPRHLALVESLEITPWVNLFGKLQHIKRAVPTTLPNLEGLASAFPNLNALVVSFPDELYHDEKQRPSALITEIREVLLDPLSRAFAQFPPEQRRFFAVELPENVFWDLISSDQFPKQAIGSRPSQSWATWLTYPITNHEEWQKLVDDHVQQQPEEASVADNTPGSGISFPVSRRVPPASSCEQDGSYFYIKQGVWSNLVWYEDGGAVLRGLTGA